MAYSQIQLNSSFPRGILKQKKAIAKIKTGVLPSMEKTLSFNKSFSGLRNNTPVYSII
jgi:hypothetical protein